MVKLAQTIGASNIASSMRQPLHMLGSVIDVRQNLWSDEQTKDAVRVFPFSADLAYNGPESVRTNSVLASCFVPAIASLQTPRWNDKDKKFVRPRDPLMSKPFYGIGGDAAKYLSDGRVNADWMVNRTGMVDYIFGISLDDSCKSVAGRKDRLKLISTSQTSVNLSGTNTTRIVQFADEELALNEIAKHPDRMTIGYVIGPRDVKLYYTEVAIGMMARRLRQVVEALSPYSPRLSPIGLGHLAVSGDKNGTPIKGSTSGKNAQVWKPGLSWQAGHVAYRNTSIPASGNLYIPSDQVPYAAMRKGFKYNHIMTAVGLELLDCLNAIGIDLNSNLNNKTAKDLVENGAGTQVAALQMLYASMFGTSSKIEGGSGDFEASEDVIASSIKEYLGTFFNSGHIHVDPGALSYRKDATGALLSTNGRGLKVRGRMVSPAQAYAEFVRAYIVWALTAAALRSYMTVPLLQCHWLYTNKAKPEFVVEQLQMNYRSDVYFDGDSSLPFSLIPTRLNPGEVLHRVPCLMMMDKPEIQKPNRYLGIRDPMPFGPVEEIRFAGDRPLTTIEAREYTFSPVIEADASVQSTYRNGRTINFAAWPRPTHYVPGATRLGAVYGAMADNKKVGGHYYYVPGSGIFDNSAKDSIYRAMANNAAASEAIVPQLLAGQTKKEEQVHEKYWSKTAVPPTKNMQEQSVMKNVTTGVVTQEDVFKASTSAYPEEGD